MAIATWLLMLIQNLYTLWGLPRIKYRIFSPCVKVAKAKIK